MEPNDALVEVCARSLYVTAQPGDLEREAVERMLRAAFDAGLIVPAAEYVEIGSWLLPEAYGDNYDHITRTRCGSKPGVCFALYARADDLREQPDTYKWLADQPPRR